jgi:hypothetical protein
MIGECNVLQLMFAVKMNKLGLMEHISPSRRNGPTKVPLIHMRHSLAKPPPPVASTRHPESSSSRINTSPENEKPWSKEALAK